MKGFLLGALVLLVAGCVCIYASEERQERGGQNTNVNNVSGGGCNCRFGRKRDNFNANTVSGGCDCRPVPIGYRFRKRQNKNMNTVTGGGPCLRMRRGGGNANVNTVTGGAGCLYPPKVPGVLPGFGQIPPAMRERLPSNEGPSGGGNLNMNNVVG